MTSSIQTPADMVNLSLRRIGYKLRIGSLYEGSAAAKAALDIYAETRDELLREYDWGFAERNINMTMLKQVTPAGYGIGGWNSTFPPQPWVFEYSYPPDCLKVRAVKPFSIFVLDFDPQAHVFAVENDNSFVPAQKVILCNVANAILTYTGQITDPTTWEADFIDALAPAIGRRLSPTLSTLDVTKMEAADEMGAVENADRIQG